jgi:serine/threonine protein kinase
MERLRPGDPDQIGPYQIINRLGSGGMGVVYMGTTGTRSAAIKIVRDFLLEDPASRTRLSREVNALKKVKSPFVAEIIDSDIDAERAWIATNYVDGPSLKTLIDNEGVLSEQKWFEFAHGLLNALAAVHVAGIVHRDVKPSNILMSASGPRLIDFGIAFSNDATAVTKTGMVAGTPTWFAPEQFHTNKITNAVDLFAAGSILYFAATGKSPWGKEDTSVATTMNAILTKAPDLDQLTPAQRQLIEPLLIKEPKDRYTAAQALSLMQEIKSSTGIYFAEPAGLSSKTKKPVFIGVLITLLIAASGAGWLLSNGEKSDKPIPKPSPKITKWSVQVEGEAKPQTGTGSKYEFFVCDQAVLVDSLKVREITLPSAKKSPQAKVISNDKRCGENFDTVVISGEIQTGKSLREYVLAGSTKTGFILQYNFSVEEVQA